MTWYRDVCKSPTGDSISVLEGPKFLTPTFFLVSPSPGISSNFLTYFLVFHQHVKKKKRESKNKIWENARKMSPTAAKQAEQLRLDGNTYFKKGRFAAAIDAYTEVIYL